MRIVFLKIGGSCLVGAESFRQMVACIRQVLREEKGIIAVVVSAFSGMTTTLETVAEAFLDMSPKKREEEAHNRTHAIAVRIRQKYIIPLYSMVGADKKHAIVACEAEVDRLFETLAVRLRMQVDDHRDVYRACIVAFGEECTVAIVRFVLEHVYNMSFDYIHASKLITTEHTLDNHCTDTTIDMVSTTQKVKLSQHMFSRSIHPVITEGFIGENIHGQRTVFEREGSDITVAAIARAFTHLGWEVPFVRYYKNVGGVFKHEPSPDEIAQGEGFQERMMLRELLGIVARAKQKILHPDAIRLLIGRPMDARIPAQVALFSTGVVGTKLY